MTHHHSTPGLHVHGLLLSHISLPDCTLLVLDPRISFEGLKDDYKGDLLLQDHLENSRKSLSAYFNSHYMVAEALTSLTPTPSESLVTLPMEGSPQKSFTARYHRKEKAATNKLEEYFKLPVEDFDTCNPICWWVSRQSQFPCLFQLAHNILCIPGESFNKEKVHGCSSILGSAVAVERIFSGG